ncbi:MAG: phosphotransferase [Pseudomonadales bacterium]|nr:phosphotransferase [Pseudomonadales bacterium]
MDDPKTILKEIAPCLAAWNVEPKSIELASHSENIVYKVVGKDDRQYALRVHRPGYHTMAELESEQMWTHALNQFGLRTPEAYLTDKGNYYLSQQCGGMERQLGLISWLEGKPLAAYLSSEDRFSTNELELIKAAGAVCAQFHNQASSWQPPSSFTRHHLNVKGFFGKHPFWGRFWEAGSLTPPQQRALKRKKTLISQKLVGYGEDPSTYTMIHADLHKYNLLVFNDELLVIDFDDAGFGWHQYDLAVALYSFIERADFDNIQNALIEGYRSKRDLSDENLSWLSLFIQVRTLALIGWASARPELNHKEYIASLIDRACSTIST